MSKTILVVEDHPTLREQIALNLDIQGYEVLEGPTGIDSLALLADKGRQIDLILLDLGLPEMDGFEVLSRTQDRPGTQDHSSLALYRPAGERPHPGHERRQRRLHQQALYA